MTAEILDAKKLGFISWADEIWGDPPKPLRRILSLMRLCESETIILESRTWSDYRSPKRTCWSSYKNSCQSCFEYTQNLCHYDCLFLEKTCYRLCFFKTKLRTFHDIATIDKNDFQGYCIIQKDEFKDKDHKFRYRSYITESIINLPFRKGRYTIVGSEVISQIIHGTKFTVQGNYFAQQNGITNSCANAAIKMALRENYPNLTAEKINELRGVDHRKKTGSQGMEAKEICDVIKRLTGLDSFALKSSDLTQSDLMKLIYHAIESRLPVILLIGLSVDQNKKYSDQIDGHAVVIKGHSFNEHNWWSYGLSFYFDGKKNLAYLPSSLWCDNFIIQDDNMGPYYLLPVKFLTGDHFYGNSTKKINILRRILNIVSNNRFKNTWLNSPFEIIVPYSHNMSFFKNQVLQIEPWALSVLNAFIAYLKADTDILEKKPFSRYFTKYYNDNSLILRTYVISKKKYLSHIKNDTKLYDYIELDVFDKILPDFFWMTEVSIPELFWINKKKIGEIITDPNEFKNMEESGVIYLRLLNNIFFKEEKNFSHFDIRIESREKWLYKLASPGNK